MERPTADDDDNDNGDIVHFATRYDQHWLQCHPPHMPHMTILGIYEDEGIPNMTVHVTHYNHRRTAPSPKKEEEGLLEPCDCQGPHAEWTRSHCPHGTSNESSKKELQYRTIRWIHLETLSSDEVLVSTLEETWHFMTSLLGPHHHHVQNPWVVNNNQDKGEIPDMVILQLPRSVKVLCNFRVSDACPSWFFHGYAYIDKDVGTSTGESPDLLYIYKRLKPRANLFRHHPEDGTLAPGGCLWERLPVQDENEDHKNEEDQKVQAVLGHPTNYRTISPPYLNLEQEYGTTIAQGLFSEEAIDIFRNEALAIPQWTPWPETHHYSVGPNGETTWTVFPLCYCFPAHDVSKRTWVEQTRHACPKTCQRLESVLGNTLRTALFSQLNPETTLEAHTGWADLANAVLRLHIPLVVPPSPGLCGTWVDGCVEHHQVGRPILFDDSKIHRAFNYSSQGRIVLIVDLARPTSLPSGYATGGHSDELDAFIAQMNVPK
jgi:hypothetical protein